VAPDTVVGLVLLLVALLPGSVYTWAYERQASAYGVTFADRTLRFIAVSVIFHVVLAWPEYLVYRLMFAGGHILAVREFALVWAGVLLLVVVPSAIGTTFGGLYATRTARSGWLWLRRHISAEQEKRVLGVVLGRTPAPRAWDNLFSERPNVYLRVRLADDTWIAGKFAKSSYAGGFPHDTDLYLEEAWAVDQETGELLGDTGLGFPIYIPAGQVRWIEVESEQNSEGASSG
jgi:hypothetical protein